MRLFSHRNRPVHLSHFPLETLPRRDKAPAVRAMLPGTADVPGPDAVAHSIPEYLDLFRKSFDPPAVIADAVPGQRGAYVPLAPAKAPIPADPQIRADNLKASAYFIDATMAGVCRLEAADWRNQDHPSHTHAFVFLVEFGKEPKQGEAGDGWIAGSQAARGDVRAAEIAGVLAGYLRQMGFDARAHVPADTLVGIEDLVVRAGLALPRGGTLSAPFIGKRFRAGIVTTEYEMAIDRPLKALWSRRSHGPAWWLGLGGIDSWLERRLLSRRAAHLGPYPMETIKRADEPTTLVLRDEIKRSPMRASGFSRARHGDFGAKVAAAAGMGHAQRHPISRGMGPIQGSMIPRQGNGERMEPTGIGGDLSDPAKNTEAVKALGYFLGVDFVGVCEAEPWMFYSHDANGNAIEPYHKHVVVMLIDQGYETMEGASGDDWISGSQSMRGYMRGAEIAGIMAAHLRRMGYSSRAHTNSDSHILHNPAILMSGLGEVSRIGDTLLNPFIGPRSKSVLFSTDLPLVADKPIDAGVQHFCESCNKCARECPCNAIPFGPKVMFNGYETWRMDAVKCTSYRISNDKGSFCGRCMKMCPWNTEGLAYQRAFMWLARKLPATHGWIARMDDKLMNGSRNLVKRWWFDLDVVDGVCVAPTATNERDLNPENAARQGVQKIALIPPEMWPEPDEKTVHPIDRASAIRFYEEAESPVAARQRQRAGLGGKVPAAAVRRRD